MTVCVCAHPCRVGGAHDHVGISQYTEVLEDSRRHALDRMIASAHVLGADAIVAVRFDSSEMGTKLTEILAYGTAVKLAR